MEVRTLSQNIDGPKPVLHNTSKYYTNLKEIIVIPRELKNGKEKSVRNEFIKMCHTNEKVSTQLGQFPKIRYR